MTREWLTAQFKKTEKTRIVCNAFSSIDLSHVCDLNLARNSPKTSPLATSGERSLAPRSGIEWVSHGSGIEFVRFEAQEAHMSNLYAKKVTELHVAHAIYLVALAQVQSARKEVSSVCQQGDMTDDERDVAMDGLLIANENARTAHDSLTVALASFIAWILNRTDSRMVRLAA